MRRITPYLFACLLLTGCTVGIARKEMLAVEVIPTNSFPSTVMPAPMFTPTPAVDSWIDYTTYSDELLFQVEFATDIWELVICGRQHPVLTHRSIPYCSIQRIVPRGHLSDGFSFRQEQMMLGEVEYTVGTLGYEDTSMSKSYYYDDQLGRADTIFDVDNVGNCVEEAEMVLATLQTMSVNNTNVSTASNRFREYCPEGWKEALFVPLYATPTPTPAPPVPTALPIPLPTQSAGIIDQSIRATDWQSVITIDLIHREGSPRSYVLPVIERIIYADLDADGIEEAVVPSDINESGRDRDYLIFEQARPIPSLVSIVYGHRSRIELQKGYLVVVHPSYAEEDALCCPSSSNYEAFTIQQGQLQMVARWNKAN